MAPITPTIIRTSSTVNSVFTPFPFSSVTIGSDGDADCVESGTGGWYSMPPGTPPELEVISTVPASGGGEGGEGGVEVGVDIVGVAGMIGSID